MDDSDTIPPAHIPLNVWDQAYTIYEAVIAADRVEAVSAIAFGILNERERCAKAVDAWQMTRGTPTEKAAFATHKRLIADAIRGEG